MAFLYPWNGSSVAIWIPERNCSPRSSSQFLYTVPDLPGTRSTQAGRGVVLPACQVYDAGEFTGPSSASVLVMPHMLINSQYLHACEAGGVIRCGLQTRLDMGPHGIPRGCQLSSQSCDGGSFEAQLSDRPADRPHKRALGAHTRSSCSRNVTVWQVCSRHIHRRLCHRILVGIPAQGASITSTTMRPWPCAITPQPGQPASWLHDSTSSTRAPGVRATLIRWKPSKPTSRSHRSQRSSDAQQQVG